MRNPAVILVALVVCGCASRPERETESILQPMVFLKSSEAVFAATIAAADSMAWEILQADEPNGAVYVRMTKPETNVTITVVSRPDGLKEVRFDPLTPEVTRHAAEFSEYVRRALHPQH